MKGWVLAAGLLAAAAIAPPATAADLGDGAPPPWRGGAYGDPRFPPYAGPPPPSYYDDDDYDDDDAGPRRYSDARPRYHAPGSRADCVRSEQVRSRLTRDGWRDFHGGKPVSETVVTLRARRPSGRLFELRLDRCSGELVAARPLELRPFGPYAYRDPRGPYDRWSWGPERPPRADDRRWDDRPYAYRGPRRWDND